jgi:hypothetical protein
LGINFFLINCPSIFGGGGGGGGGGDSGDDDDDDDDDSCLNTYVNVVCTSCVSE